jgi:hypothetical protein
LFVHLHKICFYVSFLKIRSNIHTIRAHVVGKDEKTWVLDDENTEVVPITDYSEFFVRSQLGDEKENLGILFELSIYCRKKVKLI